MKAVVINKFGGNEVVEIRDMPRPAPGPGDMLIKVHASSVNPLDWKIRSGMGRMLMRSRFPKILGSECAGEIIETGGRVKKFRKGDHVIAVPGIRRLGAFAEYACASEKTAFPKPGNISFEEAAAIPIAGLTALRALRDKGRIASGRKVLVNGASGGVGHCAVQIAKIFGAEVTGVCSGANVDFVKRLGADHVIDYTKEDFTKGSTGYDIIFDAVAKKTFGECRKVLSSKGIYISTLPAFSIILNQYIAGYFTGKKARLIMVSPNAADMEWIREQIEAGKIRIIIDRVYPMEQAKEAFAYSESGRVKGKIALKVT